mmetsp:Transcript_77774/g.207770  ORF Transcript_77774/g.207770 Transcript_77774/m.207770 type:complete len:604 (-) Transcript_77774:151-1962(-)
MPRSRPDGLITGHAEQYCAELDEKLANDLRIQSRAWAAGPRNGISRPMSVQNRTHVRHVARLETLPTADGQLRRPSIPKVARVDHAAIEANFKKVSSMCTDAWASLRQTREVESPKALTRVETADEDAEAVKLRRLRHYRMHRSWERPSPPLPLLCDIPEPRQPPQSIVRWNSAPDRLHSYRPEALVQRHCQFVLDRATKRGVARVRHRALEQERQLRAAAKLREGMDAAAACDRRRQQQRLKSRSVGHLVVGDSNKVACWLTVAVVVLGCHGLSLVLKSGRHKAKLRHAINVARKRAMSRVGPMNVITHGVVAQTPSEVLDLWNLDQLARDSQCMQALVRIQRVWRWRSMMRKKAVAANRVLQCLIGWRTNSRFFICCGIFSRLVCFLQRYWRRKRALLRTLAHEVEVIWKRKEIAICRQQIVRQDMADIAREQAGAVNLHGRRRAILESRAVALTRDERAEAIMLAKDARRATIDHELRRRRFFLLPEIDVWLSDVREHKALLSAWRNQRAISQSLGVPHDDPMPLLRQPPSAMLTAHDITDLILQARACPKTEFGPVSTVGRREHSGISDDQLGHGTASNDEDERDQLSGMRCVDLDDDW